jgi:hypothetical protein
MGVSDKGDGLFLAHSLDFLSAWRFLNVFAATLGRIAPGDQTTGGAMRKADKLL